MWPLFGGLLGTLRHSLCCTFCLLLLQKQAPVPAYPNQCLVHPADEVQPFHGIRPQWFTRLDRFALFSTGNGTGNSPPYVGGPVLRFHHATWGMGTTVQCIQCQWCCDVERATTKATTVLSVHAWRFVSLTPALEKHLYFDITTSQPLS